MSAAHRSASARVFVGKASRCGKIEKLTTPRVRSSGADGTVGDLRADVHGPAAVSYTHLDVYKRQAEENPFSTVIFL